MRMLTIVFCSVQQMAAPAPAASDAKGPGPDEKEGAPPPPVVLKERDMRGMIVRVCTLTYNVPMVLGRGQFVAVYEFHQRAEEDMKAWKKDRATSAAKADAPAPPLPPPPAKEEKKKKKKKKQQTSKPPKPQTDEKQTTTAAADEKKENPYDYDKVQYDTSGTEKAGAAAIEIEVAASRELELLRMSNRRNQSLRVQFSYVPDLVKTRACLRAMKPIISDAAIELYINHPNITSDAFQQEVRAWALTPTGYHLRRLRRFLMGHARIASSWLEGLDAHSMEMIMESDTTGEKKATGGKPRDRFKARNTQAARRHEEEMKRHRETVFNGVWFKNAAAYLDEIPLFNRALQYSPEHDVCVLGAVCGPEQKEEDEKEHKDGPGDGINNLFGKGPGRDALFYMLSGAALAVVVEAKGFRPKPRPPPRPSCMDRPKTVWVKQKKSDTDDEKKGPARTRWVEQLTPAAEQEKKENPDRDKPDEPVDGFLEGLMEFDFDSDGVRRHRLYVNGGPGRLFKLYLDEKHGVSLGCNPLELPKDSIVEGVFSWDPAHSVGLALSDKRRVMQQVIAMRFKSSVEKFAIRELRIGRDPKKPPRIILYPPEVVLPVWMDSTLRENLPKKKLPGQDAAVVTNDHRVLRQYYFEVLSGPWTVHVLGYMGVEVWEFNWAMQLFERMRHHTRNKRESEAKKAAAAAAKQSGVVQPPPPGFEKQGAAAMDVKLQ